MRQVLTGIQTLLGEPNEHSPAQADAYMYYTQKRSEYRKHVVAQAQKYTV